MRRLLLLALLCLASCKHTPPPPPPPPGGVSIDVPGVRIRVADSPRPVTVDEWNGLREGTSK